MTGTDESVATPAGAEQPSETSQYVGDFSERLKLGSQFMLGVLELNEVRRGDNTMHNHFKVIESRKLKIWKKTDILLNRNHLYRTVGKLCKNE